MVDLRPCKLAAATFSAFLAALTGALACVGGALGGAIAAGGGGGGAGLLPPKHIYLSPN